MKQFRTDPNYLLKYCIVSLIVFGALDAWLASRGWPAFNAWQAADWWMPIAALLLCGLPSSVLHNCAHGNVGGPTLNRLTGEFCGTIMLYGFGGFRLGHLFHHKAPDDPRYDPHPPRGISFPRFVVAPIKQTLVVIENAYYDFHGRNARTEANIRWQKTLFNLGLLLRTAFWFLLLGPKIFLVFFLPMYLANIFVFAHINHATHIERADGWSEIINLDHGLYYRFVNAVSFGGYYHKNHHLRPKAFIPSRVRLDHQKPYLTWVPPAQSRPEASA